MPEHVILFAGPMGAGKTAAIDALSEIPIVRTEAANTDRATADKATTTVALDYGEITIDDTDKIRLYGIPGQRRFDFMWSILKERARGLIVLVNNDLPDPAAIAVEYLDEFADLRLGSAVVVAITRSDVATSTTAHGLADRLADEYPDEMIPVFTVDGRDHDQLRTLLLTLIASIETRAMLDDQGARR